MIILQAAIAQAVERNIGSVEVTGPTPVSSFFETLMESGFFVYLELFDFT